jgi:hypothetical protein
MPILANIYVGAIWMFAILVILAFPVQHDNFVAVLLDRSGVAKIRKLGPPVRTAVTFARKLRDGKDGAVEFTGKSFEALGNVGDALGLVLSGDAV